MRFQPVLDHFLIIFRVKISVRQPCHSLNKSDKKLLLSCNLFYLISLELNINIYVSAPAVQCELL